MVNEQLRSIYLSRNLSGDHSVVTIRPEIPNNIAKLACVGLRQSSNFGGWQYFQGNKETRISKHNDAGGDVGLKKAGIVVGQVLVAEGYTVKEINTNIIPRTQNGSYEEQND